SLRILAGSVSFLCTAFSRTRLRAVRLLAACVRAVRAVFARATVLSRFSAALLRANVLADAARCIAGALRILGGTMRLPGTVLARPVVLRTVPTIVPILPASTRALPGAIGDRQAQSQAALQGAELIQLRDTADRYCPYSAESPAQSGQR